MSDNRDVCARGKNNRWRFAVWTELFRVCPRTLLQLAFLVRNVNGRRLRFEYDPKVIFDGWRIVDMGLRTKWNVDNFSFFFFFFILWRSGFDYRELKFRKPGFFFLFLSFLERELGGIGTRYISMINFSCKVDLVNGVLHDYSVCILMLVRSNIDLFVIMLHPVKRKRVMSRHF